MSSIDLATARTIVAAALAHGRGAGMQPLAVLVLDDGGHPIAFEREDGASFGRFDIARGKAHGALSFGVGSRTLNAMAVDRPFFVAAATAAVGGALVPVPGGVLVRSAAGDTLGAVGISGDNSDNDEAAAVAGIEAAGLMAVTG